eukprot:PhM_4_TR14909/c0_g1_i1/m.64655
MSLEEQWQAENSRLRQVINTQMLVIHSVKEELNDKNTILDVLQAQISRFNDVIRQVRESVETTMSNQAAVTRDPTGWRGVEQGLRVLTETTSRWAKQNIAQVTARGYSANLLIADVNSGSESGLIDTSGGVGLEALTQTLVVSSGGGGGVGGVVGGGRTSVSGGGGGAGALSEGRASVATLNSSKRSFGSLGSVLGTKLSRAGSSGRKSTGRSSMYGGASADRHSNRDLFDVEMECKLKLTAKDEEIVRLRAKLDNIANFRNLVSTLRKAKTTLHMMRENNHHIRQTFYEFKRYLMRSTPVPIICEHLSHLVEQHEQNALAVETERQKNEAIVKDLFQKVGHVVSVPGKNNHKEVIRKVEELLKEFTRIKKHHEVLTKDHEHVKSKLYHTTVELKAYEAASTTLRNEVSDLRRNVATLMGQVAQLKAENEQTKTSYNKAMEVVRMLQTVPEVDLEHVDDDIQSVVSGVSGVSGASALSLGVSAKRTQSKRGRSGRSFRRQNSSFATATARKKKSGINMAKERRETEKFMDDLQNKIKEISQGPLAVDEPNPTVMVSSEEVFSGSIPNIVMPNAGGDSTALSPSLKPTNNNNSNSRILVFDPTSPLVNTNIAANQIQSQVDVYGDLVLRLERKAEEFIALRNRRKMASCLVRWLTRWNAREVKKTHNMQKEQTARLREQGVRGLHPREVLTKIIMPDGEGVMKSGLSNLSTMNQLNLSVLNASLTPQPPAKSSTTLTRPSRGASLASYDERHISHASLMQNLTTQPSHRIPNLDRIVEWRETMWMPPTVRTTTDSGGIAAEEFDRVDNDADIKREKWLEDRARSTLAKDSLPSASEPHMSPSRMLSANQKYLSASISSNHSSGANLKPLLLLTTRENSARKTPR